MGGVFFRTSANNVDDPFIFNIKRVEKDQNLKTIKKYITIY